MTADGNGMMTSNNNNPPPNSSAVITGAQRWSPFQNDAGPAGFSISLPQQQQQGGSRSTAVSGFGVYSNPSSRTVTTSHMGSVQLPNAAAGNGSEALPPTESHRTNFQALMSQLAGSMPVNGSNTTSAAFDYNDPNNRVNQILKGMDDFNPSKTAAAAAAALGAGEGNNDINLPFTSGSLDKHQTGTTLIDIAGAGVEKKVEEKGNAGEKEGSDDQRGKIAAAGDHNDGGKAYEAYELRNRKVRLPKELLSNEEAAQEAEKNQKDGGEGADVDFRKVVDQFDQYGGASTDEDEDDEFDDEFNEADAEEEQLRKGSGGHKGRKGARRSGGRVPQKPSPATTASGGSRANKQQQQDLHNDAQAHLQAQQQGRVITSNDNTSGGSHGAAVARPSVLPHGQVGRPRNYAGDPELDTLGEEDRRRLKRRIANRESARRVRQKRQEMVDEMQMKITALSHQNARVLAAFANSKQQRQSLQNNLAIVSERFAIKLQEDKKFFMEHAAMRWALQLHGINLNDVVADYAKHNEQQRQQINGGNNIENGNYNTTATNPTAAAALATRACSLLQRPGSGGAGNGASAFNSTQPMFSAFSAPINITQPATSAAAAAAAAATAAMLPPVTSAGMAPTLNGHNMS